jgi:hypothetical protein
MLTCALKAHVKVSKSRKLHLIVQKNLMFKMYNTQFTKKKKVNKDPPLKNDKLLKYSLKIL